ARERFDLGNAPPWRARLIRLAPDDHVLVLTLHHIVSDGWSLTLLLGDLAHAYRAATEETPAPPPARATYTEVVSRLRPLDGAERERLRAYWQVTLRDAPDHIRLPEDPTAKGSDYAGDSVPVRIGPEVVAPLALVC